MNPCLSMQISKTLKEIDDSLEAAAFAQTIIAFTMLFSEGWRYAAEVVTLEDGSEAVAECDAAYARNVEVAERTIFISII